MEMQCVGPRPLTSTTTLQAASLPSLHTILCQELLLEEHQFIKDLHQARLGPLKGPIPPVLILVTTFLVVL